MIRLNLMIAYKAINIFLKRGEDLVALISSIEIILYNSNISQPNSLYITSMNINFNYFIYNLISSLEFPNNVNN